jgi:hypothetical protein
MQEIAVFERREAVSDRTPRQEGYLKALIAGLKTMNVWTALSCLLMLVYSFLFWDRISDYWFNPNWTTDDSLQQAYPFHQVFHPELFRGDLITEMVEGYLPPIHYGLSYLFTWMAGDPLMMGHWLMLIQIVSALGFLFFAVRRAAGTAPAFFAVTWLLHTRHVMQRMTSGLPRGWSPLVFSAYFYFALSGNHWGMLATLTLGCLLHPPATFVIAIAYGLYLVIRVCFPETRKTYLKPLLRLLLVSPLLLLLTLKVLHRPEKIGSMVTYQEALAMPEFQKPLGRFPFVPLRPALEEIKSFAFQAFVTRFYGAPRLLKRYIFELIAFLTLLLFYLSYKYRRNAVPLPLITFMIAAISVYFASRALAFKLYVPDRHLQIPFAYVWITIFTIGTWRLFMPRDLLTPIPEMKPFPRLSTRQCAAASVALMMVMALVVGAGGVGLNGAMNFNFSRTKKGHAWEWLKKNTPTDSLVAGEPTLLDSVFLFAARQGYVTTETAHPFYRTYNEEMKRRIAISLRAHYAKSWPEVLALLEPEGIDYFVFDRRQFYPETLKQVTYFPPLDELARSLAQFPPEAYAYKNVPMTAEGHSPAFVVHRDGWSMVIDVKKLREFFGAGVVNG